MTSPRKTGSLDRVAVAVAVAMAAAAAVGLSWAVTAPAVRPVSGRRLKRRQGGLPRRGVAVRASQQPPQQQGSRDAAAAAGASRRDVLSATSGALLSAALLPLYQQPALAAAVAEKSGSGINLSTFQRADQINAFLKMARQVLAESLLDSDTPLIMRLVIADAATYQIGGGGGANGSVHFEAELNRPENAGLAAVVAKLAGARERIAQEAKSPATLTWADTIALAGKVVVQRTWNETQLQKASSKASGQLLVQAYGNSWPFRLGRVDAESADTSSVAPLSANASPAEVKAWWSSFAAPMGASSKPGFFGPQPPFKARESFLLWPLTQPDPALCEAKLAAEDAEYAYWKTQYDRSRRTVTRTDYEVDFINIYTTLINLGARFNSDIYLVQPPQPKFKF